MAQVLGGSIHDFEFDRAVENALQVIQTAANGWAVRGTDRYPVESVAAFIIHCFAMRGWAIVIGGNFDQALQRMEPLEIELQKFKRKLLLNEIDEVMRELLNIIEYGRSHWSEGDFNDPTPEHLLNWVVEILFYYRLVGRPPKPSMPKLPIRL